MPNDLPGHVIDADAAVSANHGDFRQSGIAASKAGQIRVLDFDRWLQEQAFLLLPLFSPPFKIDLGISKLVESADHLPLLRDLATQRLQLFPYRSQLTLDGFVGRGQGWPDQHQRCEKDTREIFVWNFHR
jgi:hypothetical protein